MAAKNPVSAKTKKARAQAAKTAQKAHPVGLHSTAAQWKAYQKAYTAAYQNTRINMAAKAMRARRLQSANKAIQAYASSRRQAAAASVAAFAVQQSARQAQGSSLAARTNENLRQHLAVLSRAQYAEASSRTYMQHAVQRTVTASAAHTYEEKAYKAATKIARTSYKNSKGARKKAGPVKLLGGSANARQNQTQNVDTALRTSTVQSRGRSGVHQSSSAQSSKSNRKSAKGNKTQAAQAKSTKNSHKSSAKSKKAPVATYKSRTAPRFASQPIYPTLFNWHGDDMTPDCVIIAIANHCLATTGIELDAEELCALRSLSRHVQRGRLLPETDTGCFILSVLMAARGYFSTRVRLKNAWATPWNEIDPLSVIGYQTEYGPHAALLLPGNMVATWGGEEQLRYPIEEAWTLEWEVLHGSVDRG